MGRQVFFFLLVCCVWAYLSRDIQGEFLGIWLELRAASKVTAADYDATWGRFILPKIALFTLTLLPVIIAFSFQSQKREKTWETRPRNHQWMGNWMGKLSSYPIFSI